MNPTVPRSPGAHNATRVAAASDPRELTRMLEQRPWRVVAAAVPVGVAMQILIDGALGETAEYFNAHGLLQAWVQVSVGGGLAEPGPFVMGQERMGPVLSLLVGTFLLFAQPALYISAIVFPARWVHMRRRGVRRRQAQDPRDPRGSHGQALDSDS